MNESLRLMAILAHPDDESLGFGGTLAKYAAEGIHVALVTATRGERGWRGEQDADPGLTAVGQIREAELRSAATALGIDRLTFLDQIDGELAQAESGPVLARIVAEIRAFGRRRSSRSVRTAPTVTLITSRFRSWQRQPSCWPLIRNSGWSATASRSGCRSSTTGSGPSPSNRRSPRFSARLGWIPTACVATGSPGPNGQSVPGSTRRTTGAKCNPPCGVIKARSAWSLGYGISALLCCGSCGEHSSSTGS